MDLETFQLLLSDRGQTALRMAAELNPSEARFLQCFDRLRKSLPAPLARAALETVLLRERARARFPNAEKMYFTRESLEQATGETLARHRAKRYSQYDPVLDLCTGIGGDAIALARASRFVHAVEMDPLRLEMARANATALGLEKRIEFHLGDVASVPLPEAKAAFADPGRRSDGRRHLDPEDYSPRLSQLRGLFPSDFPLGVKVAPGVPVREIVRLGCEMEFVSLDGELKECVLWFGPLRTAARRASLLPSGATLFADVEESWPEVCSPREYLYDLDAAVVRAGLCGQVAREFDLAPMDATVALFTGSRPSHTPMARVYRIEWAGRYHAAQLREHLRARHVGRVTFTKRGSRLDSEELGKKLKLEGSEHRQVFLTQIGGEQSVIVCETIS
jgi:SAM-dependent methyltransferase